MKSETVHHRETLVITCVSYIYQNFYKYRVKTNVGKQSVSFTEIDIWKDLTYSF